jgi:ABC-type sulfate/molybdate transport systems ATPase subunit
MLVLRDGRVIQKGPPRHILDEPANLEVARLLGAYNLLEVEIKTLDPGRDISRLRAGECELTGPYFPGHLKGDRVTLCVRPEQLKVIARGKMLEPNQIPADLKRTVERPHGMRLEFTSPAFAATIRVNLSRAEYEKQRENREWLIQFPNNALRVV